MGQRLPLSHKSGVLCLYEPLPVSDALGDDFFEIFDVFFLFLFLSSLPCMGQWLQKKQSPQKRPYFAPFPGKIIRRKKKEKKKISCPRRRWTSESPKPFGRPPHRILPLSFQRPRHLPHPHPGMLHTKVVIAHLTECLVVNLEEALPHPF